MIVMTGATTNISIRMDSELKKQADALFSELGMNLSTAFNIFVRQSLREGGLPFEVTLGQPNRETMAALMEAERIAKDPSVKGYTDLEKLSTDLKAWDEITSDELDARLTQSEQDIAMGRVKTQVQLDKMMNKRCAKALG